MWGHELKLLRLGACCLFPLLTLNGCANLKAVNTASDALVSASDSWTNVETVPADSCHKSSQLSVSPVGCNEQEKLTKGLGDTDKILTAYFLALKHAADTKNFNVDSGITTLGNSAANIPKINAGQVNAITGLATFLVGLYEAHKRTQIIASLIQEGGPKARAVLDVLHDTVVPDLQGIVQTETVDLDLAFDSYLRRQRSTMDHASLDCANGPHVQNFQETDPARPMGPAFLLAVEYCQRLADVNRKTALLTQYSASLESAAKVISTLENDRSALGKQVTFKDIYKAVDTLHSDVQAIQKAFAGGAK